MNKSLHGTDILIFLSKAQNLCSRQEKCVSDVLKKLTAWGAKPEQANEIIKLLVKDDYINHSRYAQLFASEKARLSKWGPNKIAFALKAKGIEQEYIRLALEQFDPDETKERLNGILLQKMKLINSKNPMDLKARLIRHATAKGYKFNEVLTLVERIIRDFD